MGKGEELLQDSDGRIVSVGKDHVQVNNAYETTVSQQRKKPTEEAKPARLNGVGSYVDELSRMTAVIPID